MKQNMPLILILYLTVLLVSCKDSRKRKSQIYFINGMEKKFIFLKKWI